MTILTGVPVHIKRGDKCVVEVDPALFPNWEAAFWETTWFWETVLPTAPTRCWWKSVPCPPDGWRASFPRRRQ